MENTIITGYFANEKNSTKVHLVKDNKPMCNSKIGKDMTFLFNAMHIEYPYIDCEKCKKIARELLDPKLITRNSKKEDILKYNKRIQDNISVLKKNAEDIERQINEHTEKLVPPCHYCPFEGVYRCENCIEYNYAGFNVKDFI